MYIICCLTNNKIRTKPKFPQEGNQMKCLTKLIRIKLLKSIIKPICHLLLTCNAYSFKFKSF